VAEDWTSAPPGHTRRRRGAILFSHVGAILASVGIVRFCLDRLLRGSTLAPRVVVDAFGTAVSGVVRRLVGEVAKLSPDLWPAVRAHWSRPGSFLTMARHLRGLPASAALVAGIDDPPRCPVIVLAGASATDVQRARLEALAASCPRGRLVVAARGGHWIHLDEPDLVAKAIEQVIEDVRR
jgi:pimeloyl-ACP methyl ester carboxylesterase